MASPRPTSCAPRSQAMSPWRGSDPDSRGSRSRRRGPAPAARAAAAARCRVGRIPRSAGIAANLSIAACGFGSCRSRLRDPAASPPKRRSPRRAYQLCPARNRSSTASAVERVSHHRESPHRARSRARLTSWIADRRTVNLPLQAHLADLRAAAAMSALRSASRSRAPRHTAGQPRVIPARNPHSDRSAISQRLLDVTQGRVVRPAARHTAIAMP